MLTLSSEKVSRVVDGYRIAYWSQQNNAFLSEIQIGLFIMKQMGYIVFEIKIVSVGDRNYSVSLVSIC